MLGDGFHNIRQAALTVASTFFLFIGASSLQLYPSTSSHGWSSIEPSSLPPRTSRPQMESFFKRNLNTAINVSTLFSGGEVEAIQATACALAALSLVGTLVNFYWFCFMRKKFRHKLIIILILADLLRSAMYFAFPIVSLIRATPISTGSAFCQASGFLTQAAMEMADFAILFIAIHTAMQIFQPNISQRMVQTGLYRYRIAVYVVSWTVPAGMSALAFIHSSDGYISQGPTCSLPLRPFWYRLAISWIPRYVILAIVAGLYIAIYIHVKRQSWGTNWFKRDSANSNSHSRSQSNMLDSVHSQGGQFDGPDGMYEFGQPLQQMRNPSLVPVSPMAALGEVADNRVERVDRKNSSGTTLVDSHFAFYERTNSGLAPHEKGDLVNAGGVDGCSDIVGTKRFSISSTGPRVSNKAEISGESGSSPTKQIVTKKMKHRQSAIEHQLRLLFLYPLTYFIIWLMPFVAHLCNYSDYLVAHPIFVINLLSFACLASMGAVDSLIFTLREKPWRHIDGSDGTFLGSFMFWTFDFDRKDRKDSRQDTRTTFTQDRDGSYASMRSHPRDTSWTGGSVQSEGNPTLELHRPSGELSAGRLSWIPSTHLQQMRHGSIDERVASFGNGPPSPFPIHLTGVGPNGVDGNRVGSWDFAVPTSSPGGWDFPMNELGSSEAETEPRDGQDRELYWMERKMSLALLRQQQMRQLQS